MPPCGTICPPMFWVDTVETNIDRLRRYAAFTCGSFHTGDNVVQGALEELLNAVSSAEPENLPALYKRLDEALRQQPQGHADAFAALGRWQFLSPLERRLLLLIALEGFDHRQAAYITGLSCEETKRQLRRARMKYADRFPARVGLLGAGEAIRDRVAALLEASGHRLVWAFGKDSVPPAGAPLETPSAVLMVSGPDCPVLPVEGGLAKLLDQCPGRCGLNGARPEFDGPVIVATGMPAAERFGSQLWNIPLTDLSDAVRLRERLVQALLFSD